MNDRYFPTTNSAGDAVFIDPYEVQALHEKGGHVAGHMNGGATFHLDMTAAEYFAAVEAWQKSVRLARLQEEAGK